jgi:hypothetical protein
MWMLLLVSGLLLGVMIGLGMVMFVRAILMFFHYVRIVASDDEWSVERDQLGKGD